MSTPAETQSDVERPGAAAGGAVAGGASPGRSSYDDVPYSVSAYPQTRADRLAVIGRLFGMTPPDPARCRVLELGCAAGGNVIPMALSSPQSQFVGIDLSARQIEDGKATAAALRVENLDLRALSILDVGEELGTFDYILCHGVYSWVPPQVQEKILSVCSRNLSPQGIAYVSYNCYPGWHARAAIREMLWYHTAPIKSPAERVRAARGLLAFLLQFTPDGATGGFGVLIRQELALLLMTPDSYLLHEHLEEFNEPLYFHQFAERAASNGLRYLAETSIGTMLASRFGPDGDRMLRQISPDLLHMEQYMDFLRNAMFRQTLLCHADVALDHKLRPEAVTEFHITSAARPASPDVDLAADVPAEFRDGRERTLTTRDPLMKAAMLTLADRAPLPMHFDALVDAAAARRGGGDEVSAAARRELAARLLNCHLSGLLDFSISAPGFTTVVSALPVASPYARLRAREGGKVLNVLLERVEVDPLAAQVLQRLDGTHDHKALLNIAVDWIRASNVTPATVETATEPARAPATWPSADHAEEYVSDLLKALARHALLIA